MNALTPLHYFSQQDPEPTNVLHDLAISRKRGLSRMLQALFREGLLDQGKLIRDLHISWLPLWKEQAVLRIEGLQFGMAASCRIDGELLLFRQGHPVQQISTASELLLAVVNALDFPVEEGDVLRLVEELDNSVHNDCRCQTFRRHWAGQLKARYQPLSDHFLSALRISDEGHASVLLEQWGTIGHPWHPTFKAKTGLSDQEVMAYSPEFHPSLAIPVIAVSRACMHLAADNGVHDYMQWFGHQYPDALAQWYQALAKRGMDADQWFAVPVHPYQLDKVLPERFAAEIKVGQIVLLDGVTIKAAPTMSFRTVAPLAAHNPPHIKLPVGLLLTSAQRTVSPRAVVMGPRVSKMLTDILQKEEGFQNTLEIAPELTGLHWVDQDDDRARHLSVLFRANPAKFSDANLFAVPVGSLFADSPFNTSPLLAELVQAAYGQGQGAACAFFTQYSHVVLTACLSAYLIYGIAFEAHQQNSFILIDRELRPVKLKIRDFGDLRVFAPILKAQHLSLTAYRAGHSVFDDIAPVRDKILHSVMLCQLGEMATLLARHYRLPESQLWGILRQQTEDIFLHLKHRCDAAHWRTEYEAILRSAWPVKSLLRMRLSDTSDDVHGTMPNPLLV